MTTLIVVGIFCLPVIPGSIMFLVGMRNIFRRYGRKMQNVLPGTYSSGAYR